MNPAPFRILLVEDDPIDQEATRRALVHNGTHFTLQIAKDGMSALSCLRSDATFDLVLLDVNLPLRRGVEVLAELQATTKTRFPIVALTSSDRDADRRRCWAYGVAGYFVKPLTGTELAQLLDVICSYWRLSLPPPP